MAHTGDRGNSCINLVSVTTLRWFIDPQIKHTCTRVHVPNPSTLVARSRHQETTITRKLERVNLLLMALQEMTDSFLFDIPNLEKTDRD